MFSVGLNRAVALLAEKAAGGGKGRFQRAKPTVLKDLGEHPERRRQDRGAVGPLRPLREARQGQRHACPTARDPATLTIDEAVELIAERAAKGGGKKPKGAPKRRRRRPPRQNG